MGVLQDVVKTQMGGGGKKSCVNITLRDKAGNVIEVALWDDYAKHFMNDNVSTNSPGPIILILTHAWCKHNQGLTYNPYVSNMNYVAICIKLSHMFLHYICDKQCLGCQAYQTLGMDRSFMLT